MRFSLLSARNMLAALALVSLSACTRSTQVEPLKLTEVVGPKRQVDVIENQFTLVQYDTALAKRGTSSRIRLVRIFGNAMTVNSVLPEYRVFNVRPDSIYNMIGLKNGDILVAANDYVVQDPNQFDQYLEIVRTDPAPYVEIRRDGRPTLLKFTIAR